MNTVYVFLCRCKSSFLLGIYLGVELTDHMANRCLIFQGTANVFSTVAVSFYISTSKVKVFLFLHIFANTCSYLSVLF